LKICHVNVYKGYRGGERQTELLIRELSGRGFSQILVARRAAPLAARVMDLDVDLRNVSGSIFSVFGALKGADIVHVHEGRSIYAAYLRSLLAQTPYVATRRVNNPIRDHRFAHAAYRRAKFVAAVAPQVADVVRAFDAAIRVRVIHSSSSGFSVNPVEHGRIKARFSGRIVIGHVAALDMRQKAQEHIITVARDFSESRPELLFVLVGGGKDEAELKRLAAGLDNVLFVGFVGNVGDYLAAFDMFILPSRYEGIGSVLFDAMDQSLPIIATRVGGIPDIVHDGVNGLLIDPDSPEQLSNAILALVASPQMRADFGRRGRSVGARYTASLMADRYVSLYRA
jgi:glycosyltransferase involved in cell wall biosynthesis